MAEGPHQKALDTNPKAGDGIELFLLCTHLGCQCTIDYFSLIPVGSRGFLLLF